MLLGTHWLLVDFLRGGRSTCTTNYTTTFLNSFKWDLVDIINSNIISGNWNFDFAASAIHSTEIPLCWVRINLLQNQSVHFYRMYTLINIIIYRKYHKHVMENNIFIIILTFLHILWKQLISDHLWWKQFLFHIWNSSSMLL